MFDQITKGKNTVEAPDFSEWVLKEEMDQGAEVEKQHKTQKRPPKKKSPMKQPQKKAIVEEEPILRSEELEESSEEDEEERKKVNKEVNSEEEGFESSSSERIAFEEFPQSPQESSAHFDSPHPPPPESTPKQPSPPKETQPQSPTEPTPPPKQPTRETTQETTSAPSSAPTPSGKGKRIRKTASRNPKAKLVDILEEAAVEEAAEGELIHQTSAAARDAVAPVMKKKHAPQKRKINYYEARANPRAKIAEPKGEDLEMPQAEAEQQPQAEEAITQGARAPDQQPAEPEPTPEEAVKKFVADTLAAFSLIEMAAKAQAEKEPTHAATIAFEAPPPTTNPEAPQDPKKKKLKTTQSPSRTSNKLNSVLAKK